ncbi:MAG: hypothetical protein Q8880_10290, partial [Bacteroidota bacterium]|nr:hypothetical protein [Bacteroidota bacterium]
MAQVIGPLNLKGTVYGLTHYQRYGKEWVRKKTSLCKEKMYRNPNYERTLENCMEFGGCSKIASDIRSSLRDAFGRNLFDFKHTPQLLISVLRKISLVSKGKRGKRNIEISNNTEMLNNIQLSGYYPGKKISKNNFTAPYSIEIDN